MAVNYTGGELVLSGTVTNAEFYSATSTAGLSRNSENMYALDADIRISSGADVSGLRNIIISLNTKEIYCEDDDIQFNQITFMENDGRSVADRIVFKPDGTGDYPSMNNCQFIHNIVGNSGSGDSRYLTMAHIKSATNTVFRASDFSEQEIDGVTFTNSGLYRDVSGVRVKRFIASQDNDGNAIRVMAKDLWQSSKIYSTGGIICAYNGSSVMVSNWTKEILDSGATNNWMDNYNGHLGTHYVYLLGTANDAWQADGSGISQKKTTLNVIKGGHKYYNFQGGNGGKFAYFDSRGTNPQTCVPVFNRADMLDTDTVIDIGANEKIEFVTQTMRYYHNGSSWITANYTGQKYRARNYGKIEINGTFSDVESVEGTPEAYAPVVMLNDSNITESDSSVVSTYTGISISGTTINISSGTWTPSKLYDYCKYWLTQNMSVDNFITASGVMNLELSYKINISGTAVFNIDPESESISFSSSAPVFELTVDGGTVNIGSETTSDGLTTYSSGNALSFGRQASNGWNQNLANIRINNGGTFNHLGGDILIKSTIYLLDGCNFTLKSGAYINSRSDVSTTKIFFRSWGSSGINVTGGEFKDITFGSFRSPNVFGGVKMTRSSFSAVGSSNSGTNTPFVIRDFNALGNSSNDFYNECSSVVSLVNISTGTNLSHNISDADPDVGWFVNTGGSKAYKEIDVHVIDGSRNNIENALVYIKDTNNGNRTTITSAGGTVENFTADKEYKFTTDSTGKTGTQQILTGVFYFNDDGTPENVVDRRSNANDGNDIFTISINSYNYLYSEIQVPLTGNGRLDIQTSLVEDPVLTVIDADSVSSWSGISVDHSSKTITLSSGFWTANRLYDYIKYNKTLSANVSYPTISSRAVEFSDGFFESKYRVIINSGATFNISTLEGGLRFSDSCPTPCLSGEGASIYGFTSNDNGLISYDNPVMIFENEGSSWYQNQAYIIGGNVTVNGLTAKITRPISTSNTASVTINKGVFEIGSHSLPSPYEINFSSPNIVLNDFTLDGRGTFIITDDLTINKFTGKNYDGIFPSGKFRGSDTDFLTVRDYEALGSYNDHTLWRRNKIKWYNNVNGTDIKVNGKESSSNAQHTGISEFWSDVKLHITDADNNPQEGVRFASKDYDDSNRTDTSGLTGSASSGHYNTGFDYTADRTYTGVTDSDGYTSTTPILIGVVDRSVGGAQTTPNSDWSYRGKNGDNSDEFEFFVWQYGRNLASINMGMKGAGVKNGKIVTTVDINVSEQDVSVVSAYSGISIDHNTRTVTISTQHSLGEIYDYMVYDKTTAVGIFKPTLGTKIPTVVGSTIDLGDYNLIVDGCDISTGDSGFSLLQTTGIITLQNGATIDFNFLDSVGNALLNIDVPVNWTLEGVYPTQNDAVNQTNKVPNSSATYKYLTTSKGGDVVWFRVEDGDGSGVGFDSYTLPITRGVYGTAAITTTEDSLLNQIRALVRDNKTLNSQIATQTSDSLTKTDFDDFQVRTGYSLSEVVTTDMNYTGSMDSSVYVQTAGKIYGNIVDIRGSVLSKVRFYAGQSQTISNGVFDGGVVKFKICKFEPSGSNQVPSVGEVLWESENTTLDSLSVVSTRDFGTTGKRYVLKKSEKYDLASLAIKVSDVLIFLVEVISGQSAIRFSSGGQNFKTYYWSESILDSNWIDNIPAYIYTSNSYRPSFLEIEKYNYESVDSQRVRADISDIKEDQYTTSMASLDKVDIMDTSKRSPYVFVSGCPTAEANGAYRLISPEEVDILNSNLIDSNLSAQDTSIIDRTQPVYGLNNNKWILCGFMNNLGYKVCKIQSNSEYYACTTKFYPFYLEDNSDPTVDKSWYGITGKYTGAPSPDGTLYSDMVVDNIFSYNNKILEKTKQLTFQDGKVNSIIDDQLTETEMDDKIVKGWR